MPSMIHITIYYTHTRIEERDTHTHTETLRRPPLPLLTPLTFTSLAFFFLLTAHHFSPSFLLPFCLLLFLLFPSCLSTPLFFLSHSLADARARARGARCLARALPRARRYACQQPASECRCDYATIQIISMALYKIAR